MKNIYIPLLVAFILTWMFSPLFTGCSREKKSETSVSVNAAMDESPAPLSPALTKKAIDFRVEMQGLWQSQVTWSRQEILSLVENVAGASHAHQRLLENQEDIADLIRAYYGSETTDRIEHYLKENVNLSADLIKAVKAKDNKLLSLSNRKWFANADSIAVILSDENPNYGKGELKLLLHQNLRDITHIAEARLRKDYDGDVAAHNVANERAAKLSDVLTEGIIHKFPHRFN